MANYDLDISQNTYESNKSQHFPTIDFIASYDYYSDVTGGARFGANKRESSSVGLTITLPIYQGGYQSAKVSESRYRLENAQIKQSKHSSYLKKKLLIKLQNMIYKKEKLRTKEKYNLHNLKYIAAKEGFRAGIYTDTELQQSKIELLNAKNSYIDSILNFVLLDLDIKQYKSKIGIDEIEEINSILVW